MKTFLYIHKPTLIWKARISLSYIDPVYPLKTIPWGRQYYGNYPNTRDGMLLIAGRTDGADDLGRHRLKGAVGGSFINIGMASYGNHDGEIMIDNDLLLADTIYFAVYEDYRVWAKIPEAKFNAGIWPDGGTPVSDIMQEPYPCANAGHAVGGTISPTTGKLRVPLDGGRSFQFITTGVNYGAVASYSWNIKDGTLVTGTLTSRNPTVDFPPGFRYVDLTVTATNGKTHLAHLPVFARDPNADDSQKFQIVSHQIAPKGQELRVKLQYNLDKTLYPDGMMAILWEEDFFWRNEPVAGTKVLFHGWHNSDTGALRAGGKGSTREVTMNFHDVNGRLSSLIGFTQIKASLQSNGASLATSWDQARYNNIFFYVYHLLFWYSTALTVVDFLVDYAYLAQYHFVELGSDDENLYDQINGLLNNVTPDHYLCCTKGGQLLMSPDIMIMPYNDRADYRFDTGEIFAENCIDVNIEYNNPPRVGELLSGAILSGDSYGTGDLGEHIYFTVFSLAPGKARGQGSDKSQLGDRIALSQDILNICEGNRYMMLNSPYGSISISMTYDAWVSVGVDIDPAYMKSISFTTVVVYPIPIDPPGFQVVIKDMNVIYTYDTYGETRTVQVNLERETWGPPAATFDPDADPGLP